MINSNTPLLIGLDIGSTTIKAVVVDEHKKTVYQNYYRHHANQANKTLHLLTDIEKNFPQSHFKLYITGSGGKALAPLVDGIYIQEVNAVTFAVETLFPQTNCVIELGGQDAKTILWNHLQDGTKTSVSYMNDKCAGGTGATIDRLIHKIGLSETQLATLRLDGQTIHPIAAKCGVFAETDVVGLLKSGIDREEIFISLCAAVVKQNLEVLLKGNVLRPPILLLGGPHTFIPVLTDLWRMYIPDIWQIHNVYNNEDTQKVIGVPDQSQYFAALGAVYFGKQSALFHQSLGHADNQIFYPGTGALRDFINNNREKRLTNYGTVKDGLINDPAQLVEFKRRYGIPPTIPQNRDCRYECYLGIDGGSTSTKLVLIDQDNTLLYRDYLLSTGNPIEDLKQLFHRMLTWGREKAIDIAIMKTGITGYAQKILREVFHIDVSIVETVAHMNAARAYFDDIDVICDVGGQDIKIFFLKHGHVVDFKLNTQCSAGNGYFLQSMAKQFAIPIEEYADHAFSARKAPAFHYGCAIFMEQDKVNFQQLGWSREEIMAGLALVLPLNIWNYVVQDNTIIKFNTRFLLQGGTQKNLAAVKAQVDYITGINPDATVFVHPYTDVAGAIGAALEVKKHDTVHPTRFIGLQKAAAIDYRTTNNQTTRCSFCTNHCLRTKVDVIYDKTTDKKARKTFYIGYACDKGQYDDRLQVIQETQKKHALQKSTPNLVRETYEQLFTYYPELIENEGKRPDNLKGQRNNIVVGIPRLLNMYYYAPFYHHYFMSLGVKKVVFSEPTSDKLWEKGNKFGANDPCFPAKVAPAHIYNLLNRDDVTHICFPRISQLDSHIDNTRGDAACVIQMGTPEIVDAVFTRYTNFFEEKNITYWKPFVSMNSRKETAGMLYEYFKDELQLTKREHKKAIQDAYRAQQRFSTSMQERGRQILDDLVTRRKIGILMLGHPYHYDPGLNHGILDDLQNKGYPIITIDSLPRQKAFLTHYFDKGETANRIDDVWSRNFNRNINYKVWAARIAARHPNLAVVDLSSFKCGFDACTYGVLDKILDATETPHFLFHDIDQNKPKATFTIRVDTIDYYLKREAEKL